MHFHVVCDIFATRSPLQIPHIQIPQECVLEVASVLRVEINQMLTVLRDIGTGRDIKQFLTVSSYLPSSLCEAMASFDFVRN